LGNEIAVGQVSVMRWQLSVMSLMSYTVFDTVVVPWIVDEVAGAVCGSPKCPLALFPSYSLYMCGMG